MAKHVIYETGDISFRLHRNGRFSLRYDFDFRSVPDVCDRVYREASGKSLPDVFGQLYNARPEQLEELRAVLAMGETYQSEARALQKQHSAKLRCALSAAKAQREGADLERVLSEIREANGGAL